MFTDLFLKKESSFSAGKALIQLQLTEKIIPNWYKYAFFYLLNY